MAKRTGVISDLTELDITLSKMERELATLSLANVAAVGEAPGSNQLASRVQLDRPPAVTGLRLVRNVPGSVTVKWDPLLGVGLETYQVQVSSSLGFPRSETSSFFVGGGRTRFEHTDGPLDEDLFFRVRARTAGRWGPYSSTVNGRTGEATPNHLLFGATGNLSRLVQVEFIPDVLGATNSRVEYGFVELETVGGVVLIMANMTIEYVLPDTTVWYVRLKEDGETIFEVPSTWQSHINNLANVSIGRGRAPSVTVLTAPAPGVHLYSVEMEMVNPPTRDGIVPLELEISLLEVRR